MLFPLNIETPQCAVFELLNKELLLFLQRSINATNFSHALFSTYLIEQVSHLSECWINEPTREKFEGLWNVMPNAAIARQQLFDKVNNSQNIGVFFDDLTMVLPELETDALFNAFKALTVHLFTRTKDLAGVKKQSDSSIEKHYQAFVAANGGSHLCFICGTAALSQNRIGLADDDQWRADYDHVLCKDKYPIFSVHPGNFLPTCHFCNSKAKGARNLLKNLDGNRRRAFYPMPPAQESCHRYADVVVTARGINELRNAGWDKPLGVVADFSTAPANLLEKIEVWKKVYQVPSRVEEKIVSDFCEQVASDLISPRDFSDFQCQLARKAAQSPAAIKKTEWCFWWYRLYVYLAAQDQNFLRDIWELIKWKLEHAAEDDMSATFGI
jgi:hypothetical protein